MSNESTNSNLDQQLITQLIDLAEQTEMTIRRVGQTLPSSVFENLSQISANLKTLSSHSDQGYQGNENLIAMFGVGRAINSTLELNQVLRIVMDTIIRLTNAERGFLMLRDKNRKLSIRIARNWERESINPSDYAISRSVIERVINTGHPILTTNAQEDPRFGEQESVVAYHLRSILCVPLNIRKTLIGVIYADNRIQAGVFTEYERDLLAALANQAAVAIENARLFESVRKALDEVTELKNLTDNVFASIASGVLTADTEDKITMSNFAAEKILGTQGDDIIGLHIKEILPSGNRELASYVQTVKQNDQDIIGVEIKTKHPVRGNLDLRLNISPLKDATQNTQGVAIVVDDLTETYELVRRQRLFERMVSPEVIAQLDPDTLQLGGTRAQITTLFTDIRGFTSFSEVLDPEELVRVLNLYLAEATEAILAHGGTVDKFLGDAVMAWFNAPVPQPDHGVRAVRAALDIQAAISRLHRDLPPELRLSFGTGIHFGEVLLGLLGTEKRLDYTAIGDSVNTAKRIQENATSGQILISDAVYKMVSAQVDVKAIDPIQAKGKSRPLSVYEVLGVF